MKCRNCKHNGFKTADDGEQYSWCAMVVDNLDVDEERECACYVPATHADQIRAMTDEELAEQIAKCVEADFFRADVIGTKPNNKYDWLEWLKEEVEE